MSWWDRVGKAITSIGDATITGVSDVVTEVADAFGGANPASTPNDSENPIGDLFDVLGAAVKGSWGVFAATGEAYNDTVFQPLQDVAVAGQLASMAPLYKRDGESLGDYLGAAWAARDKVSFGEAAFNGGRGLPDDYDPVHDPEGSISRRRAEAGGLDRFATGSMDFTSAIVMDPLNAAAPGIKAARAGQWAPKMVAQVEKDAASWWARRSLVSTDEFLTSLSSGKFDEGVRFLTGNTDPLVARKWMDESGMKFVDPDTAAYLTSKIDDPETMKDFFGVLARPQSQEAFDATRRIGERLGADFEYYVQRHAGADPLAEEVATAADDILDGPKTQSIAAAVLERADAENAAALERAQALGRGLDKLVEPDAEAWFRNAPGRSLRGAEDRALRKTARQSNDPTVSMYKPHRWHPTVFYVERPAGFIEPQQPDAWDEVLAAIRDLDKITNGGFTASGRTAEIADDWFRAGTQADPANARALVAGKLNDIAVAQVLKKHDPNGILSPEQRDLIVASITEKAKRATSEMRSKGWLAAQIGDEVGIIRTPLMTRATANAVHLYDYRALDRKFKAEGGVTHLASWLEDRTMPTIDSLQAWWKVGVLFRLGYTIRNLTEASLSMAASGNLGMVLAEVGADRVRSWKQAATAGTRRGIDRVGVSLGAMDSPQVLADQVAAWEALDRANTAHAKDMLDLLTQRSLNKLAKTNPELAEKLATMRAVLAAERTTFHATHGAPADAAELGNLASGWKLDRKRHLSTSPSLQVAGSQASARARRIGYEGLWENRKAVMRDGRIELMPTGTSPLNPAPEKGEPLEFIYRAVSEEDWQAIQSKGFMQSDGRMNIAADEGTVATYRDPTFYLPSGMGDRGVVLKIKYDPADQWRVDSDGYLKTPAKIPVARIVSASEPWVGTRGGAARAGELDGAHIAGQLLAGVEQDIAMAADRITGGYNARQAWDGFTRSDEFRALDRRVRDMRLARVEGRSTAVDQVTGVADELEALAAGAPDEIRAIVDGWVARARKVVEFDASVKPRTGDVRAVTSYGDELDLTQGMPEGFDPVIVKAARKGDRNAIQMLSDDAYNRGYARIVLPDSGEWGGVQVVVNPKAIGPAALKREVDRHLERMLDHVDGAQAPNLYDTPLALRPPTRVLDRRDAKKARRMGDPVPLPVDPDYEQKLMQSFLDGGIEPFVQKIADRRRLVDTQIDFLSSRLAQARARTRAKRPLQERQKGFQQGRTDVVLRNGVTYPDQPEAFAGEGGSWWLGHMGGKQNYKALAGDTELGVWAGGKMMAAQVDPTNPRYYEAWTNILNLHFKDFESGRIDPVVQRILEGERFDDLVEWALTTKGGYQWRNALGLPKSSAPASLQEASEQIAKKSIDPQTVEQAVAGLYSAVDLYLPKGPIRDTFLTGGEVTVDLLQEASRGKQLAPLNGLLIPSSAEAKAAWGRGYLVHRGVEKSMEVLGAIPESSWARHPLFAGVFAKERRARMELAQESVGPGGRLSLDQINRIELNARHAAEQEVRRTLFTITRRSSISSNALARTLFPFVSAYENVLQRWSRFLRQDPTIALRGSAYMAKLNQGALVIDENGEEVKDTSQFTDNAMLVLPGLDSLHLPGKMGEVAASLMKQTQIPVASMDVLFQGQLDPGLGPIGVVPIAWLVKRQPKAEAMFKWALPMGVPQSTIDAIAPTALRRAFAVWGDSGQYTNAISKAHLVEQWRYEQGIGPKPDYMKTQSLAATMFFMRGAIALASPVASTFTNERDWYMGKYRQYTDQFGMEEGETRFFIDFPDAGMLVESLSRNAPGVRAATGAVDNAKKYRGAIAEAYGQKDPEVAGFIMNYGLPEEAEFSQASYQWQRNNGPTDGGGDTFREVGNPVEQVYEAHVRDGWRMYREVVDGVRAQLSLRGVSPDDPYYDKVMSNAKTQVAEYIRANEQQTSGTQNWYTEYRNPDGSKYLRREVAFKDLLADETFMRDHSGDGLVQSMQVFFAYRDEVKKVLAERKAQGGAATLDAGANADLAQWYDAQVEGLKVDSPEFSDWHVRYFGNDRVMF